MSECLYYDAKDVMEILKVGKHKANDIMHIFEQRGELLRIGKTMRVKKVYFDRWLDSIDGPNKRKKALCNEFQRSSLGRR